MSNAVRDVERLNQRQIETARRRNERELKQMENAHQDYKAELKKTHENEIVDIQNNHLKQLASEADRKEKLLEEMRQHLQQTRDLTDKELKSLKENVSQDTAHLQQKLTHDRERINSENQLYLEELNHRFNESSKNISAEGNRRIENTKDQLMERHIETERFYDDKIAKQTQEFTTRYSQDEKNYKAMKDQQDNTFKKERINTNIRQQTEMQKMTDQHVTHFNQRDEHYRKGFKEQDLFFEKKYASQLEKHNQDFKTLEEKNNKVVEDLKASLTKEITKTATRNSDPFYQFDSLRPKLSQYEDRVEVQVEIPEHSKEDVQLTIHGKEAIVNFNRRYNDASKTPEGTIHKINKVETFTSRVPTSHILDPKSVKSTYENGVMTYVIKKA